MAKRLLNFKKLAILVLATIAISLNIDAQQWYVLGRYTWSPPEPQGTFEVLYHAEETIEIDGMTYQTIVQDENTLVGAYREEDNKVFYCKWNGTEYEEEYTLYNYNLNVGNIFLAAGNTMKVTEVSTIIDNNGVSRKKLTFEFINVEDETEYWIEGVGSNRGFIHVGKYLAEPNVGAVFNLLCYHIDDNVIFVNPEYNTCDINDIEETHVDSDITIYPNPASEVINILNNNNLNITNVEIIDMTGRTVLSSENSQGINISELPEGQYFVKIIGETTTVKKLFIIK